MPISAEQPIRILVEAGGLSGDRLTSWQNSSSACFWASSPRALGLEQSRLPAGTRIRGACTGVAQPRSHEPQEGSMPPLPS